MKTVYPKFLITWPLIIKNVCIMDASESICSMGRLLRDAGVKYLLNENVKDTLVTIKQIKYLLHVT